MGRWVLDNSPRHKDYEEAGGEALAVLLDSGAVERLKISWYGASCEVEYQNGKVGTIRSRGNPLLHRADFQQSGRDVVRIARQHMAGGAWVDVAIAPNYVINAAPYSGVRGKLCKTDPDAVLAYEKRFSEVYSPFDPEPRNLYLQGWAQGLRGNMANRRLITEELYHAGYIDAQEWKRQPSHRSALVARHRDETSDSAPATSHHPPLPDIKRARSRPSRVWTPSAPAEGSPSEVRNISSVGPGNRAGFSDVDARPAEALPPIMPSPPAFPTLSLPPALPTLPGVVFPTEAEQLIETADTMLTAHGAASDNANDDWQVTAPAPLLDSTTSTSDVYAYPALDHITSRDMADQAQLLQVAHSGAVAEAEPVVPEDWITRVSLGSWVKGEANATLRFYHHIAVRLGTYTLFRLVVGSVPEDVQRSSEDNELRFYWHLNDGLASGGGVAIFVVLSGNCLEYASFDWHEGISPLQLYVLCADLPAKLSSRVSVTLGDGRECSLAAWRQMVKLQGAGEAVAEHQYLPSYEDKVIAAYEALDLGRSPSIPSSWSRGLMRNLPVFVTTAVLIMVSCALVAALPGEGPAAAHPEPIVVAHDYVAPDWGMPFWFITGNAFGIAATLLYKHLRLRLAASQSISGAEAAASEDISE